MTANDQSTANRIAQAAALLEAVARDTERAVDFDVPLRCGQAATLLHGTIGFTPTQIPFVGDVAEDIRGAIDQAVALLSALPDEDLSDPVLDALLQARAAAAAVPVRAVP